MNRILTRALLLTTLLVAAACGGDGGTDPDPDPQTGTVSGRVTAAGAGVPGASVSLTGQTAVTTNATGNFTFSNVPTGARTLSVTAPAGFESDGSALSQAVTVGANQTHTLNFTLRAITGGSTTTTVQLVGTSFSPANVTIAVGNKVRWENQGGNHDITPNNPSQPGAWVARDISGTETFEHTFTTAGTFPYTCTRHSGMNGTVVVQ